MSTVDLNVRETSSNPNIQEKARRKTAPSFKDVVVSHLYLPSQDGWDENLLILLHGLGRFSANVGDNHIPFAKLGRSLNLPQTAVLSLQAPELVPFLYEEAYQWYPSFTQLGELIEHPNPTPAIDFMLKILKLLTDPASCGWPANRIHFFGFAQGGTVALETALKWWRDGAQRPTDAVGSVVSISGPLVSFPTLPLKCSTRILVFYRENSEDESYGLTADDLAALRKGFSSVQPIKVAGGSGMPRSKDEWKDIMRFWSDILAKADERIGGDGVYEVVQ